MVERPHRWRGAKRKPRKVAAREQRRAGPTFLTRLCRPEAIPSRAFPAGPAAIDVPL
jgi:hypothetical protein